jgi:hypothetical protein
LFYSQSGKVVIPQGRKHHFREDVWASNSSPHSKWAANLLPTIEGISNNKWKNLLKEADNYRTAGHRKKKQGKAVYNAPPPEPSKKVKVLTSNSDDE